MSVIEYKPVAGLTITQALETARLIARKENKKVIANINDIIMCISHNTNIKLALNLYQRRLEFKYEIEKMKRKRQK